MFANSVYERDSARRRETCVEIIINIHIAKFVHFKSTYRVNLKCFTFTTIESIYHFTLKIILVKLFINMYII